MTLPVLIAKYQNLIYVTKLEKTVSSLEQTFALIMAREEADSLEDTSFFQSITWNECGEGHYPESYGCGSFFKKLQKELKFEPFLNETDYITYALDGRNDNNSKGHWNLILPDGSAITHYFTFYKTARTTSIPNFKVQGHFRLDINGTKTPNRYGRDIYWFAVSSTGHLVPSGSEKYEAYDGTPYWRNGNSCGPNLKNTSGYGCGARIIESGWKMDY